MSSKTTTLTYCHTERVRYADTDAQGHVFFGNYYTYMDETVMAYLAELGYPWSRLLEMGVEIYYAASECQYRGRSFFGDRLQIFPEITRLGKSSLSVEMTINRPAAGGDEVVAVGSITGVFVDTEQGRPTPIPAAFREAVRRYQEKGPAA